MIKKFFYLSGIVLTLLLIAGCNDGDQAPDEEEVVDSSDVPGFMELISEKQSIKHKIVYEYSISGGQGISGEMTIYNDYPKKRVDADFEMNGQKFEARIYSENETDYTACMQQGGNWSCYGISFEEYVNQSASSSATLEIDEIEVQPSNYDILFDKTRNLAGVTAYCFDVSSKTTSITSNVCYSMEGALLYGETKLPDSVSVIEAKEFTTNVTASDFEPPAEVINLSDMIPKGVDLGDFDLGDFAF